MPERRQLAIGSESPERVLFPRDGVTKGDLAQYYVEIGDAIVPHLRDRPFTLKRYPHGIDDQAYFHKQAPKGKPPAKPPQAAAAKSVANAGAIRPPAKPQEAKAEAKADPQAKPDNNASLLTGAQPTVPAGTFDGRWGTFR